MEIYRGKRMTIEKKQVRLASGKDVERVVVHPGDAAAVLPVRADGCCYLLRQFRYAVGEYILEAPAGTMRAGERPEETARRELIEETGLQAETFIDRGFILTSPGFTDERIFLFEAHGLSPSCLYQKDEDEDIELLKVQLADLPDMIHDGRISDAKTIALAYRCFSR
ncbi:MAG: NUDIX hydrolase [Methanomicrobiales archaeon]|nr:NUDIX hydrolase [Methanomicrobiales archaeon]NYT21168.1 NUDIX hydrolase [Methanomicrobiales archaeon]